MDLTIFGMEHERTRSFILLKAMQLNGFSLV